jgi:hypothetical protein
MRPFVTLLLVALLALASGCSTVRLAYNNADRIVAWMADDYLDLNREQEEGARVLIERFHGWHRRTQLPDYARLLQAADERLRQGLSPADVEWALAAARSRYETMARHAHRDVVRLLATLSDAQVASLERKLEQDNREWMQEHGAGLAPQEQKRLRAKRLQSQIERWTGSFSSEQSERLAASSYDIPLVTDAALRYRLRRQHDFLALLRTRDDAHALQRGLQRWLLDADRRLAPEYEGAYDRFAAERTRFYVDAFKLLDSEQRAHLAERLRSLSADLRALAEQAVQHSNLAVRP